MQTGSALSATPTIPELDLGRADRGAQTDRVVTQGSLLAVSAVALGMVLSPGPNMVYLVSRSITQSRRAGIVSLAGVAIGFLVYLTAANLGLSMIFVHVPELYAAVKFAGAAYLGWLAFQTLRAGGTSIFEHRVIAADPPRKLFMMGLLTNLLNPKAAIMYLSLIPQFVEPGAGRVVAQGFILGGVQIGVSLVVNLAIVAAAGTIAAFLTRRPGWLRAQRYLMGSVLGAFAVRLATDHSRPAVA